MIHEATYIEGDKKLANNYHHSHIDDVFNLIKQANVNKVLSLISVTDITLMKLHQYTMSYPLIKLLHIFISLKILILSIDKTLSLRILS